MKIKYEWQSLMKISVVLLGSMINVVGIYLSFLARFSGHIPARNFMAFQSSVIWIVIGCWLINLLFGTYIFYNKSKNDILYFTLLSQVVLNVYLMALTYAGNWMAFPRLVLMWNLLLGTTVMYCYNRLVFWMYQKVRGQKKILIVGEKDRVLEAIRNIDRMTNRRHEVTHVILSDYYQNVKKWQEHVDIVYLAGQIEESQRLAIYEYLMKQQKPLFISTEFQNLMMVNPNIMNFEDECLIEVSPFKLRDEDAFMKRTFDIIVSLILTVVTAPIMLITMIAIKLDSPGPVFYKQERVTLHQRTFNILKFRSMTVTAEAESGPVLASTNDTRITRVGKIIRSTRIDELPQLLNVLKGDMSLVGPRPERPFFVEQFKQQNPYYALRHHVRAGITGYAQVYGKYSTDFNSKLNFDLLYIKNYSMMFDFKLLFQTIKILFDKVSARGIEQDDAQLPTWEAYREKITIIE